jgi:predicted AlkP superfamily pyrophosphatase or phosphodiesterase
MSQQTADRTIVLDDYLDPGALDVFEWSGTLTLAPRSSSVDEIYTALKGKHPALAIYKREELPADLGYGTNPRVAPIVGLIDDGWRVTTRARIEEDRARNRMQEGAHGYDPKNRSMHGLFVAAGPNVKQGAIVTRVQSVDVYDFLCTLLELPPNQNDGDLRTSRLFLRN